MRGIDDTLFWARRWAHAFNGNFVQRAGRRARRLDVHSFATNEKDRVSTQALAMMIAARLLLLIASIGYATLGAQANGSGRCERLQLKTPLVYTQDKAPRDLSGVVSASSCVSSVKF
jgi:hypothetical protein